MKLQAVFFLLFSFTSMANIVDGSCTEEDNAIYSHDAHFIDVWRSCAKHAWGNASKTTNCIIQNFAALSLPCGQCFGGFTGCAASNCRSECFWDSSSAECKECGLETCGPAWVQCTGSDLDTISH